MLNEPADQAATAVSVVLELDSDVESGASAIDVPRLYRLWEASQWSAYAIDFSRDAVDWRERLSGPQRHAARWNYALFLHGEEAVARTLAPFIIAAPTQEQRIFLTTQIVDEARHHVFFDRFLREVVGEGRDIASTLDAVRPELTWGFKQVFGELDRLTDRLRRRPSDRVLYARCIALYHLVVEGTLAHPGQHLIRSYVTRMQVLPGLAEGIGHVARDESRHMAFGIQVLADLLSASPVMRTAVIQQLNRVLPWTLSLFMSPDLGDDAVRVFGVEMEDIYAFALRSFEAKLRRIGISPADVAALVKIGGTAAPEDKARRALRLLRAGVFGNAAPLRLDDEILALIFDGVEHVANMTPASRLPGPIQWDFVDAPAWYLAVDNGRLRARPGRAPTAPVLTLRCRADDWALIAGDKLNPTWAAMSGRVKVSGDPRLALRLPALLGGA